MSLNETERKVLEEATHGAIKPHASTKDAFLSLISKKLITHLGNNKYKATPEGIKVSMGVADAPKGKAKSKPAFLSKVKKTDAELDAEYSKKYPHYVKGSIGKLSENGEVKKRTALIKCKCGKTRKVFTSDLFQVKLCLDCKKAKTAAQAKASLAKLKGKTKKAA